jgi:hypothetical protein
MNLNEIKYYKDNLSSKIHEIETLAELSQNELELVFDLNEELLEELTKVTNQKLYKKVLYDFIDELDFSGYDTEYREFILISIENIAKLVNVDIRFKLNQKLYGSLIAILLSVFRKK